MILVPTVVQQEDYSCGSAALLSVLRYWQVYPGDECSLRQELGTNTEGTSEAAIVNVARQYGLLAYGQTNIGLTQLRQYVADGYTVIISYQACEEDGANTWEDGHYAVVVDVTDNQIVLMDPSFEEYEEMGLEEFLVIWHEYSDAGEQEYYSGVVIYKPNLIL
jgi:predicted double-glycine peptidase